jgi:hypothetical protein
MTMQANNYPPNYLLPTSLETGAKSIAVGRTTYQAPTSSRVVRTTVSGKPVAIVRTPAGRVHELHEAGEKHLTQAQEKALHAKHFAKP